MCGLWVAAACAACGRGSGARRAVLTRRFLVPAAVMAAFLIVVGTVNYFRWGKPTTFADYTLYLTYHELPDQMLRLQLYGPFNLARVPFGLSYYFLPLWVLPGADGRLLFENTQTRLMNGAELPPGSFFLTDLLPIAFIIFLAMALWAARPIFCEVHERARYSGSILTRCRRLGFSLMPKGLRWLPDWPCLAP